jgi:glycosyltransferase involved in cell wall biosynthesis
MMIGIDASRAFLPHRTGIEEYSYQVIRHLANALPESAEVVLYVRKQIVFRRGRPAVFLPNVDFPIPPRWTVRGLWAPRLWTQARLSWEMVVRPPAVLFVPAHTVPLIHPQKTIVTIHGLEYEHVPEGYTSWERLYMRWSIHYSVRAASSVIAVSAGTKHDLMEQYRVPAAQIEVIHEGVSLDGTTLAQKKDFFQHQPYFFFIGRLETRKNIVRMIGAFSRFKERTGLSHRLILAGRPGHGYDEIKSEIKKSSSRHDIQELGYIGVAEKWAWLEGAEALLFPSLYEGFGLPVIEAQTVGVPVIASATSSLPEIGGTGALFVDPLDSEAMATAMERLVRDPQLKTDIIKEARVNAARFSWAACAQSIARLLTL